MNKEQLRQFRADLEAVCRKHGTFINSGTFVAAYMLENEPEYTQEQLTEAFKLVQDTGHWKNPIDCKVYLSEREVDLVGKAVVHFAGCPAHFKTLAVNKGQVRVRRKRLLADDDTPQLLYRVTAPGYYMSVGA